MCLRTLNTSYAMNNKVNWGKIFVYDWETTFPIICTNIVQRKMYNSKLYEVCGNDSVRNVEHDSQRYIIIIDNVWPIQVHFLFFGFYSFTLKHI